MSEAPPPIPPESVPPSSVPAEPEAPAAAPSPSATADEGARASAEPETVVGPGPAFSAPDYGAPERGASEYGAAGPGPAAYGTPEYGARDYPAPGYSTDPGPTFTQPAAPGYGYPPAYPPAYAPQPPPSAFGPPAGFGPLPGSTAALPDPGYPGRYPVFAPPAPPAPPSSPPTGPPAGYGPGASDPDRTDRGPSRRTTILVAAVIAALVGAGVGAGTVAAFDHHTTTISSGIAVSTATAQNSAKVDGTVTGAAAKISPSVVTINVAGQSESGTGSGIILRSDGYILTNDHVVAVAGTSGKIQVITTDGQSTSASIVGVDQSDDLAVVKVTGLKNLVSAVFAPSSALQVGQTVVAVGAPLGLSNTVTSGIVSNTARPVQTGDSSTTNQAVFDAIQTDAAINPGNSGGPLVNLNGDVVGINAAIATADSGGVQVPGQTQQTGSIGIGFAIPSDEASRIAAELIASGKATHAILGVSVQDATGQTSIATTVGATVATVTANGPAAGAGIKVGDVITKVADQQIGEDVDLVAAIRSHAPGQSVAITYLRGGTSHTVQITLGTASS